MTRTLWMIQRPDGASLVDHDPATVTPHLRGWAAAAPDRPRGFLRRFRRSSRFPSAACLAGGSNLRGPFGPQGCATTLQTSCSRAVASANHPPHAIRPPPERRRQLEMLFMKDRQLSARLVTITPHNHGHGRTSPDDKPP